jgi:hypothetical protein
LRATRALVSNCIDALFDINVNDLNAEERLRVRHEQALTVCLRFGVSQGICWMFCVPAAAIYALLYTRISWATFAMRAR